jgi:hypothetical protein
MGHKLPPAVFDDVKDSSLAGGAAMYGGGASERFNERLSRTHRNAAGSAGCRFFPIMRIEN